MQRPGSPTRLSLTGTLALATLVSWSCCTAQANGRCGRAESHFLFVYPDGTTFNVSDGCVRLSKRAKHKVAWISVTGADLKIQFTGASPFRDLRCHKDRCFSGEISPDARGRYSYTCELVSPGGTQSAGDPDVMIDP